MSAWASADAAALKKGEASDDHFGLLLLAYPVSDELKDEWARARATLERDPRLSGAYWMPPEHLHVTIATLRRYDAAKLNPADREVTLDEWRHILDGAKISQGWPPAPFRLRVTGATFRGGCATLDISDEDGAIAAMRSALELSIRARGGHAVVGGGDSANASGPAGACVTEKGMCGTPYYMSPEIWRRQPYGAKTDVWSLGCVALEVLTGHGPWEAALGDHDPNLLLNDWLVVGKGRIRGRESPLAASLFEVVGVESIFLAGSFITVTKSEASDWTELAPPIVEAIKAWAAEGGPALGPDY